MDLREQLAETAQADSRQGKSEEEVEDEEAGGGGRLSK